MRIYGTVEKLAFQKAMIKLGWVPNFSRAASRMIHTGGSLGGAGAAGGALIGGGVQSVRGYQQARQEGATGGQAVLQGAMKGVSGATTGAAIGAGAGAATGAALGKFAPAASGKTVQWLNKNTGAISRFGQRQAHWLTGWRPKEGLSSIGVGAGEVEKRLQSAQKRLVELKASKKGELTPQWLHDKKLRSAQKKIEHIEGKHLPIARKAEKMGLTSLPGYARSLAVNGVTPTLGTALKESWHSSGPVGKALLFGFPALSAASGVKNLATGEEGGGAQLGSALGMAAFPFFSPMNMMGQMAISHPIFAASDKAGTVLENAIRKKKGVSPAKPQVASQPEGKNIL